MPDFDVQQVREAVESRTRQMGYLMSHRETGAALAVIVPAVTQQIRALHRESEIVIWRRDALGDDHQDQISHCALCGDDWPCPTVRLLDQLDAAAADKGAES